MRYFHQVDNTADIFESAKLPNEKGEVPLCSLLIAPCESPLSIGLYLPLPSAMVAIRSMPGTVTCSTLPSGQWISISSIFEAW